MRQKAVITKLLQLVTEVYSEVRLVLQSVAEVYYKMCQVLQSGSGITKCDRLLLQNASAITKCDSYYKVRRNTPSFFTTFSERGRKKERNKDGIFR